MLQQESESSFPRCQQQIHIPVETGRLEDCAEHWPASGSIGTSKMSEMHPMEEIYRGLEPLTGRLDNPQRAAYQVSCMRNHFTPGLDMMAL